ncbi:MAG: hypothetical protein KatS3mg110_4342 [Pirellulaceae bacterium]|nr:MAG: hypothetical protein KatS3mg110_4342 [Pirellulaceae bacterium]
MYTMSELLPIAGLSLYVSGSAVLISGLLGVPLGAWLGLSQRAGFAVRAVVHTLMALPPVVVGLALYLLLSRGGPLGRLGWLYTPKAMILAQTLLCLPLVVGITMSAVAAVPGELVLQIRSLGATRRQVTKFGADRFGQPLFYPAGRYKVAP